MFWEQWLRQEHSSPFLTFVGFNNFFAFHDFHFCFPFFFFLFSCQQPVQVQRELYHPGQAVPALLHSLLISLSLAGGSSEIRGPLVCRPLGFHLQTPFQLTPC